MTVSFEIQHDELAHRFHTVVDGQQCQLVYSLGGPGGAVMSIDHTGVPAAVGGRGIAAALVQAAFALARQRGWKVKELNVERGRLDEVFRSLTRGEVV